MSINFAGLAAQGRAKSGSQAWSPEEWSAVCLLVKERHITRISAADYVRNGISTVEAFDEATKKAFVPLSQDEAAKQAEESLKARGAEIVGAVKTTRKKSK